MGVWGDNPWLCGWQMTNETNMRNTTMTTENEQSSGQSERSDNSQLLSGIPKWQAPRSCNKCKGYNEFTEKVYEQATLLEAYTKCSVCGFEDYWAYGFFQSGESMFSNCETYTTNAR